MKTLDVLPNKSNKNKVRRVIYSVDLAPDASQQAVDLGRVEPGGAHQGASMSAQTSGPRITPARNAFTRTNPGPWRSSTKL